MPLSLLCIYLSLISCIPDIKGTLADKLDVTAVTSWRMQTNRMGHYNTLYYRRVVGSCGNTHGRDFSQAWGEGGYWEVVVSKLRPER